MRPGQSALPQWSRAGTQGATPGASCRFPPPPPPQMLEQSLREEEELRAQQQAALLRLRQKALEEKMRAERAWLNWLKLQRR